MVSRGRESLTLDSAAKIIEQLRSELNPEVLDASIEAIKAELGKEGFDATTSELTKDRTEAAGGSGALVELLNELIALYGEAKKHITAAE